MCIAHTFGAVVVVYLAVYMSLCTWYNIDESRRSRQD